MLIHLLLATCFVRDVLVQYCTPKVPGPGAFQRG